MNSKAGAHLRSTHMKPYTYGAATQSGGYQPMIGGDSLDYAAIRQACESVCMAANECLDEDSRPTANSRSAA